MRETMERVGCYTTARVTGGRIERLERHAARLRRDAARLALALPERIRIESTAQAVVRAELGHGDGVLRLEWSRIEGGPPDLFASTRPLGSEASTWRAITARAVHPGPGTRQNAKVLAVAEYEQARAERAAAGVDESLLFDAAGRLVEGSRTNLILATPEGRWLTPARSLGPVEGLGLACLRESIGEIREAPEIDRSELLCASELVAVNAVRGAVAITHLDGTPIGDARPGPLSIRSRAVFAQA